MRTLILSLAVIASATIYAQPATFQRGDLVRVLQPTTPEPRIPAPLLTVVAIPNDRIRIDDSALYVNDVPVTGFSPDFLARVVRAPERVPQVVPEGHYFLMGEQRINQDITEYWGQHFGGQLARAPR